MAEISNRSTPLHGGRSKTQTVLKRLKESRQLYLMLVIPVVFYIIFAYKPMYGVLIAFKQFNARVGIMGSKWVGFKWFEKFLYDPYFWRAVRNTLVLSVGGLLLTFPLPIIFAFLLNELRSSGFKRVVQTITYLPHFFSTMVVCGMVTNFLSRYGLINNALAAIGFPRVAYLNEPSAFFWVYHLSGIWQSIGWGSILYLAAMTGVNQELYEVARLDGANRFQRAIHITLPAILPTVSIQLIFACGGLLGSDSDKILLLYNSTTRETADTIATYIYRYGIEQSSFSLSTAAGLFSSVIGLIILLCVNKASKTIGGTGLF